MNIKNIINLNGYSISDTGFVISNARGSDNLIMIPRVTKKGYLTVWIRGKHYKIHRLVAAAFIGDIEGMEINHKDGVKTNNHRENLEVVTGEENRLHAQQLGLTNINYILSAEDVREIRSSSKSRRELAERYNVSPHTIKDVRRYRCWKHI